MLEMKHTIKELRREAGLTQERLAQMLGITVAAVSKWECGESFPDITLLPEIADILGVSTDRLLGYDRYERKTVPAIIDSADVAASEGNRNAAIDILARALARYPGNIPLTFHLARHKFAATQRMRGKEQDALLSEVEADLSLVAEGNDVEYRGWALHFLTTIAIIRGDIATAERMNSAILPPKGLYPRGDRGVILTKRGNDADITEIKELALGSVYEYVVLSEWLISYLIQNGNNETALCESSRLISVLEAFEESGLFCEDLSIAHETAALCLAGTGDFEGCLDHLEKSARYAVSADTAPVPDNDIFGIMSSSIRHKTETSVSNSLKMTLLSSERREYDPMRENPRFDAVLSSLN